MSSDATIERQVVASIVSELAKQIIFRGGALNVSMKDLDAIAAERLKPLRDRIAELERGKEPT